MTTGKMRPPLLGGFLVSGGRDPPAPNVMIPIIVKAVILCRKDQFNETIEIPIEYRMGWLVPAYVIVESYHLEPWVNELG